jgi:glyoxylase-like metal-dependent hydrolase (beta-lactamase superfamily II)
LCIASTIALRSVQLILAVLLLQPTPEAPICIGERITQVQSTFARKYGVNAYEYDGMFDQLLEDDEETPIGKPVCRVLQIPGHTRDHIGYVIDANVFVGDWLFQPDAGSARCNFPGGDVRALFRSVVDKLYSLPDDYRIYVGHDYAPGGSGRTESRPFATVAEQCRENKHIRDGVEED